SKAADKLNLTAYLQRTPKALSGGQRQRVAIGRAIVRQPKVFLFDEPLSNLDAALRGQTRVEIAKLHRELGATTIYVTHDQVEAMTLADRVVVLRDGMIEQVGTPLELYDTPANRFVAQFIGMPQMNVLPVSMFSKAGNAHEIGVRPEHLTIVGQNDGQLRGTVELVEALGNESLIHVNLGSAMIIVRQYERTNSQVGDQVGVQFDSAHLHRFDKDGKALYDVNKLSGVAA
ncbi:MAG TPA: TOBE domain-containing protein, partial [Thiolinea sp.]|nr:TOBE domain-containing protein [Thiolinea sp.]